MISSYKFPHLLSMATLLLLVAVHLHSSAAVAVVPSTEANALLEWKSQLPNRSRALFSSWNDSSSTSSGFCSWKGLTCDAWQSVTGLNLSHIAINGTLQGLNFLSLPNLTTIVFINCSLSGGIPSTISNLSKLTTFDLGINSFSGGFPVFLGYITSLQYLSLSDNYFTSTIPGSIATLSNLT
ncbi:hypothetical protein MLD38_037490 [Melastoma candidum]|uniref:Uncharacterized protein n=1 Tax=Melastoma candidum TaxID=119954 RepID=A0ACB9LNG3_9MYRT|nr:hypothetical protein MLD38_037490 [Melastoma candidum]